MHELSIAAAILGIAEEHAQGRPITRVDVRIGHLRQVVPSSLAFAFELLTDGAVELHVEAVPATGCCRACGRVCELDGFPLHCAACGGLDLELLSGEELVVDALELDDDRGVPEAASAGQMATGGARASGGPPGRMTTTGGRGHGDH